MWSCVGDDLSERFDGFVACLAVFADQASGCEDSCHIDTPILMKEFSKIKREIMVLLFVTQHYLRSSPQDRKCSSFRESDSEHGIRSSCTTSAHNHDLCKLS